MPLSAPDLPGGTAPDLPSGHHADLRHHADLPALTPISGTLSKEEEKRDPEDHSPPQSPAPEPTPETPETAGSGSGEDSVPVRKEARNARSLPVVDRGSAKLDPARIETARQVHKRIMDLCGIHLVAANGGQDLQPMGPMPGRYAGDGLPTEIEPGLRAQAMTLKAELLASLVRAGPAGFLAPRRVRPDRGGPGQPPRSRPGFADLLMVRWRDDRPEVRALLEDAAALLTPDRVRYLVGKAEDAGDPIRYARKSFCQALGPIRWGGERHRAAGRLAKIAPPPGSLRTSAP